MTNQARRQGVTLTEAEKTAVKQLVREQGVSPAQAVATLKAIQANPGSAFAQRFGLPSDADVSSAVAKRNATGKWQ